MPSVWLLIFLVLFCTTLRVAACATAIALAHAVGKGTVNEDGKKTPLDVKAGDRVLFGKYSGSDVTLNGQEYVIMKEEDVLGILG